MSKQNELVLFEDELAKLADAGVVAERSTAGAAFMSTKGGILTYRSNPIANNTIDVVIIGSPVERLYYADRYDPTKPSGPACFALSPQATGMRPSAIVENPTHATCEGCPKNEWGSAPNGGKGKACRETRRILMLVPEQAETPEAVATAEVAALRPPVTSLKAYATYLQTIATMMRRPLAGVVTRISLVPDPRNQFRVQFDFVRKIEDLAVVKALIDRGAAEVQKAVESAGMEEGEVAPEFAASSKF